MQLEYGIVFVSEPIEGFGHFCDEDMCQFSKFRVTLCANQNELWSMLVHDSVVASKEEMAQAFGAQLKRVELSPTSV